MLLVTFNSDYVLTFVGNKEMNERTNEWMNANEYSVDDSLTLRLCDSALASTLFPLDYHSLDGTATRLPVKWMSIEALEDGISTAESDVVKISAYYLLASIPENGQQ